MAELLPLFTADSSIESKGSKNDLSLKKPRVNRIADFHLKKMDILSGLMYTEGNCGMPIIGTTVIGDIPNSMIALIIMNGRTADLLATNLSQMKCGIFSIN